MNKYGFLPVIMNPGYNEQFGQSQAVRYNRL
jgi:hypothetical protein